MLLAGGILAASGASASAFDGDVKSRQPAVARKPKNSPVEARAPGKRHPLTIVVVDERGRPLANATVTVRTFDGKTRTAHESKFRSSKSGRLTLSLPESNLGGGEMTVQAPKYAAMRGSWWNIPIDGGFRPPLPKTITFRMQPGIRVGGKVVDESGRPVPDATVRISIGESRPERSQFTWREFGVQVKTATDGTWTTGMQVSAAFSGAWLIVEHPKFVNRGRYVLDSPAERSQLRTFTHRFTLERGVPLEGFVRGPDGKPVAGAIVLQRYSSQSHRPAKATTNQDGHFRFDAVPKGRNIVMVLAKGRAPELSHIEVSDDLDAVNFTLKRGKAIRLRVVDAAGKPLAGVAVTAQSWRGQYWFIKECRESIPQQTGKDGRLVWKGAPPDEVEFNVIPSNPGLMHLYVQKFTAREAEYLIKLLPALRVSLRVVDAKTKKPIPRFTVDEGTKFASGRMFWPGIPGLTDKHGRDGRLTVVENSAQGGRFYRVKAKGYRSATSREVKDDEGKATLKFELTQAQGPHGTVIDAAGKPIAEARVYLGPKSDRSLDSLFVANGATVRGGIETTTDAKGRFTFDPQDDPFGLFVAAKSGYAIGTDADLKLSSTIAVRRWARIEGALKIGTKPGANEAISLDLSPDFGNLLDAFKRQIYFNYKATTDKHGRFVFEKVPMQGTVEVGREIILSRNALLRRTGKTHTTTIELKPGQTTKVTLGGTGRPVVGRLQLPDGVKESADWNSSFSTNSIREALDPAFFFGAGLPLRSLPSHSFRVEADGSFRVEDLPPGDYELSVRAFERQIRDGRKFTPPKLLGKLRHLFSIEPIRGGRTDKPLQLGTLKLNKP